MVKENGKIRVHDERLAIFEFGCFVERSMEDMEKEGVTSVRLDFRRPNESPDATLVIEGKDGEFSTEIEFEGYSKNFTSHEHGKVDLIVCSLHNWKDPTLPVWEICYGDRKIFEPHQGTKGSIYEHLKGNYKKRKANQQQASKNLN